MFHYVNDELFCEQTPLARVAAEVGTPVYVYSRETLLAGARAYRQAAPEALICFAMKANGNPALLRLLREDGLGMDVTSGGELFLAQYAGVPSERIIYSGVGKTAVEINAALEASIYALHVESEMEFETVAAIAAQRRQRARIGVRVNPDVTAGAHPYISTGGREHKFGVDAQTAVSLLRRAAADPWLEPVGLAAHIGSQITALEPFGQTALFLVDLAARLAGAGVRLRYLDVGGGLGVEYGNEAGDAPPSIAEWVTAVAAPVRAAGYGLVIEPGRSIAAPAGALLAQVLYLKRQEQKQFAVVDAGMNDLLRPALYQAHHPILPLRRPAGNEQEIYNVVGPVCETSDWLAHSRALPPLAPGAAIAVLQAGAYGMAMGSNYNGRLRPAEVLVDGQQFHVIRRRQTYNDLLEQYA